MEFDIFIPDLSLAAEYHGEQHYHSMKVYGSNDSQKARDVEKKQVHYKQYQIVILVIEK
jgi:hypothetical protein